MRYKGKTPVKKGDVVELLAIDDDGNSRRYSEAKVVDALASQFTVRFNKRVHFYFYEDKDVTWRKINGRT